jgi:2-polyprenyl-6-methoxyphenol hydroxylase-like FAD-dependent oxidoreductase
MTARDGTVRDFSVPPGQVRPELIQRQNTIAEALFCPPFLALWRTTRDPFVQPILDLALPRMRQGRVAMVGDAAFIPRPHTAASTSKAITNARALGAALGRHLQTDAYGIGLEHTYTTFHHDRHDYFNND